PVAPDWKALRYPSGPTASLPARWIDPTLPMNPPWSHEEGVQSDRRRMWRAWAGAPTSGSHSFAEPRRP
ncbi:MAG: hypothetical protein EB033_15220, partial [Proteobacteria bacterium]|nr:hypothetical protein [Pseudomonadota bacterium]